MRTLVRVLHGAHLFGTATPSSDIDLKEVVIPSARQLFLGRGAQITSHRSKPAGVANNSAEDVDIERFPLLPFLTLTAEGQSNNLAMIFAPEDKILHRDPLWDEILANRDRFVTKQAQKLVGYCRNQAEVYSNKGERLAALKGVVAFLEDLQSRLGRNARLNQAEAEIYAFCEGQNYTAVEMIPTSEGGTLAHLKVSDKKIALTSNFDHALGIFRKGVKRYGARAQKAEEQGRFDPKAFSHALRVGYEALELMQTGRITYPSPRAEFLTAIKTGQVPLEEVTRMIEPLIAEVDAAAETCPLPEEPDLEWIEDFTCRVYLDHLQAARAA